MISSLAIALLEGLRSILASCIRSWGPAFLSGVLSGDLQSKGLEHLLHTAVVGANSGEKRCCSGHFFMHPVMVFTT